MLAGDKGAHDVAGCNGTARGGHYRWSRWIHVCERRGLIRSMSAKGLLARQYGFFGRPEQEFYHNQDHHNECVDEFIDAPDNYLIWYRNEHIKTESA